MLGLAALGAVQASDTLFGPMTILFLGMSLVTIPEAARVLRRSPRRLPLFCLAVTAALVMAGLACGVLLLVAVPRGLGAWLLGPIWRPTYPLVFPQMIFVIGQGAGYGAGIGLHALGASRRSLRLALLWAATYCRPRSGRRLGQRRRGHRMGCRSGTMCSTRCLAGGSSA